jgi:hypothetical protein
MVHEGSDREVSGMHYDAIFNSIPSPLQEAKSGVIHVHDDDPIYFEILLRYLYEHKWDIATAQKKKAVKTWGSMSSLTLTAIGVYSLADKYEIEGLRACAIDQIPSPSSPSNPYLGAATLSDMSEVINTHYSKCIQSNCAMGRKLCLSIIKWMPEIAKLDSFIDLAKADPNLAMDMYFAGCENSGKLW